MLPNLCDVISKWETALREKGSGKFEKLSRHPTDLPEPALFQSSVRTETERETSAIGLRNLILGVSDTLLI
ncbi:hypothetical protein MSG28_004572 [Choristoneura fumiferana]|uniref:Uncharacterized protein n=1 Tax=Choristoneura fumiferana TaxID=7141 RepID=A0ACC0K771_CHOFU|nr:hypothetical protein MSG28_004572 [Choristoneura fumiferana]